MMRSNVVIILFVFLVEGVFGDTHPVKSVLGMEGDPVTLNTDVPKQHHETMRWYFNDIQIAQINGHANTSCLYDGEGGRFRDRLKVDYETGSLNITNITTEHAGRYEAEIIRSESSGKRQSLNRNRKCDSTKTTKKNSNPEDIIITISLTVSASDSVKNKNEVLIEPRDKEMETTVPDSGRSPAAVVGICVGVVVVVVLLLVAAAAVVVGVRFIHHSIFRTGKYQLQIL
ncbi:uncharacterized protein [Sinocyclocheilus grahami]|uniref:uncharacterized protein n=1 Tax=Sinocyclocheilus grahami TaxID=75366 RepID=UPI0007AC80CC|nr:PREDICTED: uncharacterized protein LOC107574541 [Sinocyclocheilus grahami]